MKATRTWIIAFLGATVVAAAAIGLWPIPGLQPSVQFRPAVVNKTAQPIVVRVIEVGGANSDANHIAPGGSQKIPLAIGESSREVFLRTLHVVVLDGSSVELSRATLTGEQAAGVKSIVIGPSPDSLEFRGYDEKKIDLGGVSR